MHAQNGHVEMSTLQIAKGAGSTRKKVGEPGSKLLANTKNVKDFESIAPESDVRTADWWCAGLLQHDRLKPNPDQKRQKKKSP